MYNWIKTGGGPHLLLPEELLFFWRGIEGWSDHRELSDTSDYARACRVTDWLGAVPCHDGRALVLAGDVGPVAWISDGTGRGGKLIQVICMDDEANISAALLSYQPGGLLKSDDEQIEFKTGSSGRLFLFDSAEPGDNRLGISEVIELVPGTYHLSAVRCVTEKMTIIVRSISRYR